MALSEIADKKKFSGAVLFFGAMQFLLFVSIAEFVATNFTVSGLFKSILFISGIG